MIHTGNTLTIDFCDFVFSKILDILLHDSKIYFLREVLSNVRFCIHCNSEKVKEKGIFRVFKRSISLHSVRVREDTDQNNS